MIGVGMGGHQSARMGRDEWLTPPHVLASLGSFDLDPCAPQVRPWPMAAHHYTIAEDGLRSEWFGRVWMNPPYGQQTGQWLGKLAKHGRGTALIFARTETDTWHRFVWPRASAVLFLRGRLFFCDTNGKPAAHNAGAPSALVAFGRDDAEALRRCSLPGALIYPHPVVARP